MKNSSLLAIILLLIIFLTCSCSSHEKLLLREKRFMQYWKALPDCCVSEIKSNKYDGMILNGRLLSQTDKWLVPTIESLLNRKIDSLQAFEYIADDSTVLSFEKQCLDSLYKSNSPYFIALKGNLYYRQYLGLILDGNKYLFVSFQKSNPHCGHNNHQRKLCYQVFRLIYSRSFLIPGIDFHPKDKVRFWMLYNVANKQIYSYPINP